MCVKWNISSTAPHNIQKPSDSGKGEVHPKDISEKAEVNKKAYSQTISEDVLPKVSLIPPSWSNKSKPSPPTHLFFYRFFNWDSVRPILFHLFYSLYIFIMF